MRREKQDEDDDGRVIADMSDLSRPPLLVPDWTRGERKRAEALSEEEEGKDKRKDRPDISGGERRAMIRGSLAAALLVLVILAAAFALVILLIGGARL